MATSSGWKWYSCSNICFLPTLGSAQSKDATLKVDNMHCLDFASCSRCQGTPDHPSHTATLCNRCFTDQKRQIHYAVLLARNFCTNVSLCNVVIVQHIWGDRAPLVSTAGCFDLSRLHTSHSFAENQFIPNLYSTPEWAPTVLASVADMQKPYCAFWGWMFKVKRTKEELCKANGTFVDDMQKSHVFRCVPTPMSHRPHGNTL